MPLEVIVLAAGQGKRMRSDLPKVLHPVGGRPLLAHVLDAAHALQPKKTLVVHGHGAEKVRAAFADAPVEWVLQAEQLGTGHAVQQAMKHARGNGDVLILYGDVPLVRPESLKKLVEAARDGVAVRSEEHTSELQSHSDLVCRLLLEKKNTTVLKTFRNYVTSANASRFAYSFVMPVNQVILQVENVAADTLVAALLEHQGRVALCRVD